MNRRFSIAAAVTLAALALVLPAIAHGPTGSKVKGANGGEIVDVEGGHIELVVGPAEMLVYISDLKDAPLASAGLTARAIIQDGARQTVVPLSPREPNLLVAPLASPLARDTKIAVSTNLAIGGKPVQARFVVK